MVEKRRTCLSNAFILQYLGGLGNAARVRASFMQSNT